MVAEGMAQGIGASGRQTVLAVFVGSGMAFAVGMGFQMRHQFGGEGGVVAEFALLDQLVKKQPALFQVA